jgi:hypothetical protein
LFIDNPLSSYIEAVVTKGDTMNRREAEDPATRIAGQVRKAHQLARWLRVLEFVYGGIWLAVLAVTARGFLLDWSEVYDVGGWSALASEATFLLESAVFLAFLLVLAESARRIVLVVAGLAEDVKGTV